MGIVGGPRQYHGSETRATFKWTCKSCGTEHLTPFEDGCPSCGAGTAAQAEVAKAAQGPQISDEDLMDRVLCRVALQDIDTKVLLLVDEYSDEARRTVMSALAFYAEQGTPMQGELTRAMTLAWARKLYEAEESR